MARVRDQRGWSKTFEIAGTDEARLIQGGDGVLYVAWVDRPGGRMRGVCLQAISIEEVTAEAGSNGRKG